MLQDLDLRRQAIAAAVFVALTIALVVAVRQETGAAYTYPLDDTYIHTALARNLIESHTWGINPGEFANASTSPVWTVLIAIAGGIIGWSRAPLLLGVIAGIMVLLDTERFARAHGAGPTRTNATLAAVLFLTPLPFLAAMGLEHILHLSLALAFVVEMIGERVRPRAYLLAAVLPLVRPESLFLVGAAVLVRATISIREGGLVAACGLAPFALFCGGSLAMGGLVLPNSVLMKSGLTGGGTKLDLISRNLSEGWAVVALVGAAAAGFSGRPVLQRSAAMFVATSVLQLVLGGIGWVYRYEAWLVGWGIALAVSTLAVDSARWAQAAAIATVLAVPSVRAFFAWTEFVPQALGTHLGDRQIAELVGRARWPGPVAVHDIGIIRTITDNRIIDVAGIATTEIAKLHLAHELSPEWFGRIVAEGHADLAIVDTNWMAGNMPPGWVEVGTITFPITHGRTAAYGFWATRPEAVDAVRRTLVEQCPEVDSRSKCELAPAG
jgi:hypothetical protein